MICYIVLCRHVLPSKKDKTYLQNKPRLFVTRDATKGQSLDNIRVKRNSGDCSVHILILQGHYTVFKVTLKNKTTYFPKSKHILKQINVTYTCSQHSLLTILTFYHFVSYFFKIKSRLTDKEYNSLLSLYLHPH